MSSAVATFDILCVPNPTNAAVDAIKNSANKYSCSQSLIIYKKKVDQFAPRLTPL